MRNPSIHLTFIRDVVATRIGNYRRRWLSFRIDKQTGIVRGAGDNDTFYGNGDMCLRSRARPYLIDRVLGVRGRDRDFDDAPFQIVHCPSDALYEKAWANQAACVAIACCGDRAKITWPAKEERCKRS